MKCSNINCKNKGRKQSLGRDGLIYLCDECYQKYFKQPTVTDFINSLENKEFPYLRYGCISEMTCGKCGIKYTSSKPDKEDENVVYIGGPCVCGYLCPKCYPNGWKDLYKNTNLIGYELGEYER